MNQENAIKTPTELCCFVAMKSNITNNLYKIKHQKLCIAQSFQFMFQAFYLKDPMHANK